MFISIFNLKSLIYVLISILIYIFLKLSSNQFYIKEGNYNITGYITKTSQNFSIINTDAGNMILYKKNQFLTSGSKVNFNADIIINNSINSFTLSNNIKYEIKNIDLINQEKNYEPIINKIKEFGSKYKYFKQFWKLIVFGYIEEMEIYKNISELNVVHLLIISGMHFDILFNIIFWITKKIILKIPKFRFFNYTILLCYIMMLNNFVSALRAFFITIIKNEKKYFNIISGINKYNGLIIILWIIFTLQNNLIFNYGTIISFLTSFSICVLNELISLKNRIIIKIKTFIIFIIIYLINLPFLIAISEKINIFGLLFSILLTPLFEFLYIISILFWFSPIFLNYCYYIFYKFIIFLIYFSNPIINKYILDLNFILYYTYSVVFLFFVLRSVKKLA
ncbi:ComEC/Rec2-related protein [Mycoplasmopsis maculosa]|uniref:ComEC/Rec2-related protein n=1 Tax=Mycoplasmopsis maculosa TaxID=114885 RepID=A0A449B529_9BACT|nr:ComEC/Rec2-related protein [Mycoplasmopsis maculosa]